MAIMDRRIPQRITTLNAGVDPGFLPPYRVPTRVGARGFRFPGFGRDPEQGQTPLDPTVSSSFGEQTPPPAVSSTLANMTPYDPSFSGANGVGANSAGEPGEGNDGMTGPGPSPTAPNVSVSDAIDAFLNVLTVVPTPVQPIAMLAKTAKGIVDMFSPDPTVAPNGPVAGAGGTPNNPNDPNQPADPGEAPGGGIGPDTTGVSVGVGGPGGGAEGEGSGPGPGPGPGDGGGGNSGADAGGNTSTGSEGTGDATAWHEGGIIPDPNGFRSELPPPAPMRKPYEPLPVGVSDPAQRARVISETNQRVREIEGRLQTLQGMWGQSERGRAERRQLEAELNSEMRLRDGLMQQGGAPAGGSTWHDGGVIPGGDDGMLEEVPNQTLLEGEFVIRPSAVAAFGPDVLEQMNNIDQLGFEERRLLMARLAEALMTPDADPNQPGDMMGGYSGGTMPQRGRGMPAPGVGSGPVPGMAPAPKNPLMNMWPM